MTKERKIEYDIAYIKMAQCVSQLSNAIRNKVGCIIVSEDGQIISQGYNGMPTGFDNCCEDPHCSCNDKCYFTLNSIHDQLDVNYCSTISKGNTCKYLTLTTKPEVLHAETNAISKCAKLMASTNNSTMYVTLSPCFECSKFIIQSGIKRVVFLDLYRNIDGIELLKKVNILVEQIDIDNKKLIKF